MTSITIRVPDWMKAEMDRHKEINWAEVIRNCIRTKLAELKPVIVIEELVDKYLKQNDEIKLRTLDLFAENIGEYQISSNIKIMYGEWAIQKASETLSELKEIGIEKPYNKIGDSEAREVISDVLDRKGIYDMFKEKLKMELRSAEKYITDAIWLLSHYDYRKILPEGFIRTFGILHPEFKGDIMYDLTRMGMLYMNYSRTTHYFYKYYKVPLYAHKVLEDIAQNNEKFVRDNLRKLIKENWFIDFIKWMNIDINNLSYDSYWWNSKWIGIYKEREVKDSYKKTYGKDFDEVLSTLIKMGILIIDYRPEKRRAGSRGHPPFWVLRLTPIAIKYLVEYAIEGKI